MTDPAYKVSLATTVKAPLDTICHHVEHHLGIGVDSLHLFLDDASDADAAALRQRFPGRVHVHRCDAAYWRDTHGTGRPDHVEARQRMNADHALALARRNGDRWIAHLDIDEYVWTSGESLPTLLAALPDDVNVVRMDVLEAIPQALEIRDVFDIGAFKSLPFDAPLADGQYPLGDRLRRAARLFGAKLLLTVAKAWGATAARHGFHNFYNAHHMGKCITRVSPAVQSLRLHFPWFAAGTRVRVSGSSRIRMMHFESCSFAAWALKWQRRTSTEGFAAALDRRQLDIFEKFSACRGDQRQLEALYRYLYFYSDDELVFLRRLGLVQAIDPRAPARELAPA